MTAPRVVIPRNQWITHSFSDQRGRCAIGWLNYYELSVSGFVLPSVPPEDPQWVAKVVRANDGISYLGIQSKNEAELIRLFAEAGIDLHFVDSLSDIDTSNVPDTIPADFAAELVEA